MKGKTDEKLPVSAAVGVSYQPLSTLLLTVEVEKSTDTQLWFKAAGEYSPIPLLDLRMGVYGAPFSPTFGVGLNLSSFTVHAGAMWHTDLGPSVMCGLDYTF